jgi:hypothetical protein
MANSNPTDPSNEIRGRFSAIVARLTPLATGVGTLDAGAVHAALVVVEHEVSQILAALKRLPSRPLHGDGI